MSESSNRILIFYFNEFADGVLTIAYNIRRLTQTRSDYVAINNCNSMHITFNELLDHKFFTYNFSYLDGVLKLVFSFNIASGVFT